MKQILFMSILSILLTTQLFAAERITTTKNLIFDIENKNNNVITISSKQDIDKYCFNNNKYKTISECYKDIGKITYCNNEKNLQECLNKNEDKYPVYFNVCFEKFQDDAGDFEKCLKRYKGKK